MKISPLAGKPAPQSLLVERAQAGERLLHGGARSRGRRTASRLRHLGPPRFFALHSFNEAHILAITQAICRYRVQHGIDGPLFLGIDTHALSVPACASALEVLAANGVDVMLAEGDEYTPTPAVSHAILTLQPRAHRRPGRRHRRHALAQSAGGRWLQVQPAQRGAGRDRRHPLDRSAGQRAA